MITQAVIAAGGFGTRLRPQTEKMPKPMIPILGEPMLAWRLARFKKFGVSNFLITLNYLPKIVQDYFNDGKKFGIHISYLIEKEPRGTAGGLKELAKNLNEVFFYGYGDVLAFIDYRKMNEDYKKNKNSIGSQHSQISQHYEDADVAELGPNGKYIKIHSKPHAKKYDNPVVRMQGTMILNKKILNYIPGDTPSNLGNQVIPSAIDAGEQFYAYQSDDLVTWIDTAEKWKAVESDFSKKQIKFPGW